MVLRQPSLTSSDDFETFNLSWSLFFNFQNACSVEGFCVYTRLLFLFFNHIQQHDYSDTLKLGRSLFLSQVNIFYLLSLQLVSMCLSGVLSIKGLFFPHIIIFPILLTATFDLTFRNKKNSLKNELIQILS